MIVRKASVFPAPRDEVLSRLQRLETLQYIAAPYATFTPVSKTADFRWEAGASSEYRFKLFGIIPFGVHTIRIERFDQNGIQSREHNRHVPVWDHLITLKDLGDRCVSSIGLPQNRKNFSLFSDREFRIFGSGHGKQRESTGNFASCVGTDPLPA